MATILVIDDDASIRRSLRRILELEGHEVLEAAEGSAGLRAVQLDPPDLVITDIYMPEMDGIEFLIRLRDAHPELPIVVISGGGFASKEFVLKDAEMIGATRTLSKPLLVGDVLGAVSAALSGDPNP